MNHQPVKIIGQMSGTSLDGNDLIAVEFYKEKQKIQYRILATETIPYPADWEQELKNAHQLPAEKLMEIHATYGTFLGKSIHKFIQKNQIQNIDLVATHGHTIFHQPKKGFTLQIGCGAHIHAVVNLPVICDFRTQDVALGGQGAPLVPIGDKMLFADYDACINLGGFANISFDDKYGERRAFDICPVNFVLNHYAQKLGHPYDKDGNLAQQGKVHSTLFETLNLMPFYQKSYPKSLGREWVEKEMFPLLKANELSTEDMLCTFTHHVMFQIQKIIATFQLKKVLFSGGGTFNRYLMALLKSKNPTSIHLAEKTIIEYKEALIFAFLGYLKWNNQINVLKSVTGAKKDSCSGIVHQS